MTVSLRAVKSIINLVSVSGGKDSTALLLLALYRGAENIRAVFADTGHEHPETYRYIEHLDRNVYPIEVVKADLTARMAARRANIWRLWRKAFVPAWRVHRAMKLIYPTGSPFLDLCLLKGRFPSTKARFCTEELKHRPIEEQIVIPALKAGHDVISWQGVRADESPSRANLPESEWTDPGITVYRPLHKWTAADVIEFSLECGVKPNPLYRQGMGRVGCMPCIMCSKSELREISDRFPEEIQRVAEWENLVADASKSGAATFFPADKTPEGRDKSQSGIVVGMPRIHQVTDWARTTRGGRQYDLLADNAPQCASVYGLCE